MLVCTPSWQAIEGSNACDKAQRILYRIPRRLVRQTIDALAKSEPGFRKLRFCTQGDSSTLDTHEMQAVSDPHGEITGRAATEGQRLQTWLTTGPPRYRWS